MKKIFLHLLSVFLAGFLAVGEGCSSSGSPPADIPSPVSHLSVSSPDSDGLVRVTAEAGFADGGSAVTITNANATSRGEATLPLLAIFLIRPAFAHAVHEITANTDGSFQEAIEADVGDDLSIAYTKDGEARTEEATVPNNVPPFPLTANIQDVSVDPNTRRALVVANDGADGFVYIINMDSGEIETTLTLPGASDAQKIATDPTSGETIVLDIANITAWHITLTGGGAVTGSTVIVPSSDLAAGTVGGYAVIAHTDPTPAMSYFDTTIDAPTAVGDSETEAGEDQDTALFVAIDNDGTNDIAAVVSRMADGSFILTNHIIDTAVPSITQNGATPLAELSTPGGLTLFNNATEVLITDSDNDRVLRVVLADGSITPIDVGDNPLGVAADETAGEAYVVNNGDRNLSVIDLTSNGVTGTESLGLSPTEIATDPTGANPTVVVTNTGDETAAIID